MSVYRCARLRPVHTLAFLEPGHFHATLTLREANPRVAPEIFVYATAGPELDDFLALVDRFNRRAGRPTRWRLRLQPSAAPPTRPPTGARARVTRRLHDAGLPVLAENPGLVRPADLDDIRASLDGAPIVREMM